jgi:hypothetical protein
VLFIARVTGHLVPINGSIFITFLGLVKTFLWGHGQAALALGSDDSSLIAPNGPLKRDHYRATLCSFEQPIRA